MVASRFGEKREPTLLLWQFPVEMLAKFKEVYVFTHLFAGSDMAAYLRLHGVNVKMATISLDGNLADYAESIERARLDRVRPLIQVVEDRKLNAIGQRSGRTNPLSLNWFKNDVKSNGGKKLTRLKANAYTFFQHRAGAKSNEILWSTYKDFKGKLQGKGFARSFAPCNARSTNLYRDRKALGYFVNLFHHPHIRRYFEEAGAVVSEDLYALLVMTQWVWRSQIRDGMPIMVYIPSERMRGLLLDWLAGRLPLDPVNPRLRSTQPDDTEAEEVAASLTEEKPVDADAEVEAAMYA